MKNLLQPTVKRTPSTDGSEPFLRYRGMCLESGDHCDSRIRILYADDDRCILRACQIMLDRAGYDVDTVADGAEAWAALQCMPYHLVITDNEMPRLTGLELIHKVREALIPVPIVLASASVSRQEDLECDALLPKPFTVRGLLDTVRQVLLRPQSWPSRLRHRCCDPDQREC
ncbi:MAG: Transcriptional regulatory protein YycF [Verrucomicrobiota bacterium]|jgi:DNA-binding response OmpR family regulator